MRILRNRVHGIRRRKPERGAWILLLGPILLFGIYATSAPYIKRDSLLITEKDSNGSRSCKLTWRYPDVSVEFYESQWRNLSKIIHKDNFLTQPKPVESLFPNPVIRLNPDKFLLPIVYNGPNNQITGLREATFVAIKLNRTVVIPKFFKHHSDSSVTSRKDWFIYPGHRIHIEHFCKFVSCISIQQFQEACGGKIDSLFHLQTYSPRDIREWESQIGMRITRTGSETGDLNVKLIPPEALGADERHRKFDPEQITKLFDSEDRCVIYPRPLYNLHVFPMLEERDNFDVRLVKKQEDIEKLSDSKLFLSICKATNLPDYLKKIANNFVKTTMKHRPFLSVHWRYNKQDFMKRCESNEGNKLKMQMCTTAMNIKPENIATSIEIKIHELEKEYGVKITDIYIASPPSERKLLAEIAIILYEKHGWVTHSSLDLERFMGRRYVHCEIMQKHFNDILSTAEMGICWLATTFLSSTRSSWSENVRLLRKSKLEEWMIPQMDGDIYKMSVSAMEGRAEKIN